MSKPEEIKKPAPLVTLSMTFDAGHQEPARFAVAPNDSSRPDPTQSMPTKPMHPDKVGELMVLGNNLYANFISHSKEVAKKYEKESEGVPTEETFHVFLNKHQIGTHDSHIEHQEPYAAVLSCIDARVPPELITGQAANDMFAVRTAGNILLERGEARGSLEFILNKYARRPPQEQKPVGGKDEPGGAKPEKEKPLTAVLVLGHTRCGAIDAAYDAVIAEGKNPILSREEELKKLLRESPNPSLDAIVARLKIVVRVVMKLNPDLAASQKPADIDELKRRICHFNTELNYLDIRHMAEKIGLGAGFKVFFGSYHVEDCVIRRSNLPGKDETAMMEALDKYLGERTLGSIFESLNQPWSVPDTQARLHSKDFIFGELMDAMNRDAEAFSKDFGKP
ncbi:carbonic anhydrase [Singulisphaera sp. Ch08]|uniref:Carbonic anhydrase n=1 Tax=Singulisphaera sp. Ch08 TaxID=3120278 RepID=A0AAU7CN66_9BACT